VESSEPLFLAVALKTFNKSLNSALMDARVLTMAKEELAERLMETDKPHHGKSLGTAFKALKALKG
jgi:phosphoribosylcarboxyaminoimidazole (NCAIR) mutase